MALAFKKETYELIDKEIMKRDIFIDDYFNKSIFSKFYGAKIGSIEVRHYYRRLAAIIYDIQESSESEDKAVQLEMELYERLCKIGYRYEYNCINQVKEVDLMLIMRKVMKKYRDMGTEEFIRSQIVVIFLSAIYEKLDYENKWTIQTINTLSGLGVINQDKMGYKYENLHSEDILAARKLLKQIKKKIKEIDGKETPIEESSVFYIPKDPTELKYNVNKISKLELVCEMYRITSKIDGNSIDSIIQGHLKEKEFIEILTILLQFLQGKLVTKWSNEYLDKGIPTDVFYELMEYLFPLITMRNLYRAYSEGIEYFFENYQQGLQEEIDRIKKENRKLKEEINIANNKADAVTHENEYLKKELERVSKELMDTHKNTTELNSLRNLAFSLEEGNEISEDELVSEEELKAISEVDGIIFGGTAKWRAKMKSLLSNWVFIAPETLNFDTKILKGDKVIVINASHIGHAMYYKIIENSNSINFINSKNTNRALNEIKRFI